MLGPLDSTWMDFMKSVNSLNEHLGTQKFSETIHKRKLSTTDLKPDITQKKSTGGVHMSKTGSNICYLRCKITKGACRHFKAKQNMI